MLWKNRWTLFTVSNQIIRALPSFSFCYHSWPFPSKTYQSNKFSCDNSGPEFPQKGKLFLSSQVVFSTLSSCPSDLIALSFFIWCAQQPHYFHDVAAFDCMVSVVQRLTDRSKTVKGIVSELESIGCVTKAKTFLLLLRIYWRGGMHPMVVETYEQMGSHGFAPNTFASNVLMDVLFKIGQTDLALKVLKESQASNFLTFNIALFHLSKLNYVDHIKQVFRDLLRMGFYPNARTFEMLLNGFCKMNRLRMADQVLGLMIAFGFSTSSKVWTILINGFCKQYRLDDACNILKKMIETGCSPNVVTYTTLIKAFMESKRITDAFNFLGIMECSGQIPDLILCNVLIDCLSKVGRYQEALGVFVSLSKQNIAPDSYTFCSLLSTICLSRRFYLLPKLVSGHTIDADLVFCNALLSYFCKAGRPYLAVEFYNYMIYRGFTPDKYTFSGLLSGLCGARRIDEAVDVYHYIVTSFNDVDAHMHSIVTDGLIKSGKYHRAIRVLRNAIIEKYPLDIVSYTIGICGLLKSGRTQELFVKQKILKWSIGCCKR
ncbi:putative pentatricopeptide repeat-containing protein [Senna tora]|uniref:Putative pentatricopeptide repeat-containing protein n=1 Tax=Senna tora TaxID=362788 RepID=A0A834XH19_9FABA|nr:putative pentatricopeptide repeat-containing protein [Senna tora]